VFGLDLIASLDLAAKDGLVSILAEPNLTALSGETASFLAGGEFPIPVSQALGAVSILYKQYGVSLAFTPTVLADGRISMRVRPEVSELSSEGSIVLNGFSVPAITTRRAETTVELGSGQSFMIGGLIRNSNINSVDKAPGLGDVPVLGAMFRSNRFRRQETELMIIVTPYLVRPTDAANIKLPTDGYVAPTDLERVLLGKSYGGNTGEQRPRPTVAPPTTVAPAPSPLSMFTPPAPAKGQPKGKKLASAAVAPGFSK
jgi:pilus assembly protein CpaC